MSTDADRPNIGGRASPGWHIDTEPDGSGWHRWTATETTSGKTASGPAASVAVILLVVVLFVSELGNGDHDDAIEVYRSDDVWVARHTEVGVASQGPSREVALDNLDEAVALHLGRAGERIETEEEERAVLRDLGIDPDEVTEE